ncbi:MAG: hypothetical protein IKH57_10620 [Clostridia bacterium]|nr:hypothetical protein [Clostridia bacterium]
MTLRLGGCRIRAHPLLPIVFLVCALSGMGERLVPTLGALSLHEAGHILAAQCMKLRVDALEITPLGGLMTVPNLDAAPPWKRFLLAASGPLASLCGCALAPFLYQSGMLPFQLTGAFIHANLVMLLVNLLPALPLDGGEMLRASLSRFFSGKEMNRWMAIVSSVMGLGLCGVTLGFALRGQIVFAPAFAGLYLIYAAAMEGRHGAVKYITSLIARRQRLDRQMVIPVETVAAGAGVPVRSLLYRLSPGKYHMIHVLSPDGMTRLGVIEEKAFCEAVLTRHDDSLGSILTEIKKEAPAREMTLTGAMTR